MTVSYSFDQNSRHHPSQSLHRCHLLFITLVAFVLFVVDIGSCTLPLFEDRLLFYEVCSDPMKRVGKVNLKKCWGYLLDNSATLFWWLPGSDHQTSS